MMTVETLCQEAEKKRLLDRAFDSCRKWLHNDDDNDGWRPDEIELRYHCLSLVLDHASLSYPFFETTVRLYARDARGIEIQGLRQIGTYSLITQLNGEDVDEYLVFDESKEPEG